MPTFCGYIKTHEEKKLSHRDLAWMVNFASRRQAATHQMSGVAGRASHCRPQGNIWIPERCRELSSAPFIQEDGKIEDSGTPRNRSHTIPYYYESPIEPAGRSIVILRCWAAVESETADAHYLEVPGKARDQMFDCWHYKLNELESSLRWLFPPCSSPQRHRL